MNKKVNTLLFVLGATVYNILVAIISFVILMLLYIRFVIAAIPEANHSWGFTLIFILSMVISFISYRMLFKYLLTKIDAEKYFDPIFIKKNLKKD